jgi:hypothetical protein
MFFRFFKPWFQDTSLHFYIGEIWHIYQKTKANNYNIFLIILPLLLLIGATSIMVVLVIMILSWIRKYIFEEITLSILDLQLFWNFKTLVSLSNVSHNYIEWIMHNVYLLHLTKMDV